MDIIIRDVEEKDGQYKIYNKDGGGGHWYINKESAEKISGSVGAGRMPEPADLDEKIYSSSDVIKIINAEGNRFIYGAKDEHTENLTRSIFLYMADLFENGKQ